MQTALDVLRRQKPNLCGKGLKAINAARAKYRVGGKIHGQAMLPGDASLGSAYEDAGDKSDVKIGDGAKQLVAGKHYPGGLAAWKASLLRAQEAEKMSASRQGKPRMCKNGCGHEAFGKYATCCTHCTGADGPHAKDCNGKGYAPCANGCGRKPFGKYDTCCTHCKGPSGPHARKCPAPPANGNDTSLCENGCSRKRFRNYPTCCTRCKGGSGPHHPDCDARQAPAERHATAEHARQQAETVTISSSAAPPPRDDASFDADAFAKALAAKAPADQHADSQPGSDQQAKWELPTLEQAHAWLSGAVQQIEKVTGFDIDRDGTVAGVPKAQQVS
jgi:hypothetical protein